MGSVDDLKRISDRVRSDEGISVKDALALENLGIDMISHLAALANEIRARNFADSFDLCSIINARSGRCSENCSFCAQSSHHTTQSPIYDMKESEEVLENAVEMEKAGANRFSIVTSGKGVPKGEEMERFLATVRNIRKRTGLEICASLGVINHEEAKLIRNAGVVRYHHNLEACREFYPTICTTHGHAERVNAVKVAKSAGFEVCSGGIIGMGEKWKHRVMLAFELKKLGVDSIPLNILDPIPGTPLEDQKPLDFWEIIRTVAMFRLVNPEKELRVAGGRFKHIGTDRAVLFLSGLSGVMIGNLLTTRGMSPEDDIRTLKKLGFKLQMN